MEAKVSADLLTTIFTPYSPLHGRAVLVRGDRIIGAGCVLPLTQFKSPTSRSARATAPPRSLRRDRCYRAVVSEETSTISIASHGLLHRHLTAPQVRDLLSGAISHLEAGTSSAPAS